MNVNEILHVTDKAFLDNSIAYAEKHNHQPYASTTFNNNDEIRIVIQHADIYTLPSKSSLELEGKLVKTTDGTASDTAKFVNFGIAHLFDEIRYELNGVPVDRVRNVGITALMKGYLSFSKNEGIRLQNAGWSGTEEYVKSLVNANGNFNISIPMRMLMGIFEDFKKILINVRQELVLVRGNSDLNAIINETVTEPVKVDITKLYWRLPHISVSDVNRLKLLKYIEHNTALEIDFRSWEVHEFPLLQQTTTHMWPIKNVGKLESPSSVTLGLQTNRKNKIDKNMSKFDQCDLRNVTLHLNSQRYPYADLHNNFSNNHYANLYDMYADFSTSYYERDREPALTPVEFKEIAPLAVIDCSHQDEAVKDGAVDIRLEFETNTNMPANTTAYALIIFDRKVKYNPKTNEVRVIN